MYIVTIFKVPYIIYNNHIILLLKFKFKVDELLHNVTVAGLFFNNSDISFKSYSDGLCRFISYYYN